MTGTKLKIGTRGSPLALRQTEMVVSALSAVRPDLAAEIVVIKTSGDWKPEDGDKRLSEAEGGKGLFAREIEQALLDDAIDCAVHSMKDMPSFLPEGLALDHVLKRADPRDAFISHKAKSFMELPQGAVIGTSSLRRQAFVLSKRSDLHVVPLRGNVHTRLAKLEEGQVDATFLALAGLQRLGIEEGFIHPVEAGDMIPACGQGIIAIETRKHDDETRGLLDDIHDVESGLCGQAERAALQILDGSCHTPIGAYARFVDGAMTFDLAVASGDGAKMFEGQESRFITSDVEAIALGQDVARSIKARVPPDIFS